MGKIYRYEQLDSTNLEAKRIAQQGADHGSVVIARSQDKGRGRLGKSWHTVPGKGLYLSVIVRPQVAIEEYAKLTLVAGVAVARVVSEVIAEKVQLKWPNDVLICGKKCAGILAESSALNLSAEDRFVILGIGINVNQSLSDFPEELLSICTSLKEKTGRTISIDDLFTQVYDSLLQQIERFGKGLFSEILSEWREYDFLAGKEMECVDIDGKRVRGVSLGPDEKGALFIRTKKGSLHEVLSGDVRLAISD